MSLYYTRCCLIAKYLFNIFTLHHLCHMAGWAGQMVQMYASKVHRGSLYERTIHRGHGTMAVSIAAFSLMLLIARSVWSGKGHLMLLTR